MVSDLGWVVDDLQAGVSDLRALSESLMVDECRVEVPGGVVTDPDALQDVVSWRVLYEGRCRLQRVNVQASEVEAAAAFAGKTPTDLRLPLSAPELPNEARVTVTRHARLVGRQMTVKGRSFQTFERDARYACEGVDW